MPRSRRARFEVLEARNLLVANIALTTNPGVQQMPSVAVNPLDPEHVVVAYMDYSLLATGYAGIGVAVSKDSGQHWEHSLVSLPAELNRFGASGMAAPVVKFDNFDHDGVASNDVQNRVYIAFMAAEFLGDEKPAILDPDRGAERAMGMQSNNGIFVAHSDDGGLNWSLPNVVSRQINLATGAQAAGINRYNGIVDTAFDIKPDLAIDMNETLPDGSANPRYGQIYVTWVRFYPQGAFPGEAGISDGGSQIMIGVSSDWNANWHVQLEQRADTRTFETVLEDPLDTGITGLTPGRGVVYGTRVSVGVEGDVYVSVQWLNGFIVFHSLAEVSGTLTFDRPVSPDEPTERAGWPFGIAPISPTPSGLPGLDFRLDVTRAIVADPSKAGTVYVAESSDFIPGGDHGDIVFAKSTDYGNSWKPDTEDRDDRFRLLSDDNGRVRSRMRADDVTSGQVMPWLVAGENGRVALIWYDTRRDPSGTLLDVFATVSSDFGATFSPNFRVTTESFDANQGEFANARGEANYKYLGDSIGLALAESVMYAAWTDTRLGNQDIFFSRVVLDPVPAPPNDRFEENNDRSSATVVGRNPIFVTRLPQLTLAKNDEDWFEITPTIDQLTVIVESAAALHLAIELCDESGNRLADSQSEVVAGDTATRQIWRAPVTPNAKHFVRVRAIGGDGSIPYALTLSTVNEDLGDSVFRMTEDRFSDSNQGYYLIESKVTGSIRASLEVTEEYAGNIVLQIFDPNDPTRILASSAAVAPQVDLQVIAGQKLMVRVAGEPGSPDEFRLTIANVDQYNTTTAGANKLFFASGDQPAAVALADFNNDLVSDMVVSNTASNTVSVYIGNGDGTFQAPRQLAVGAFAFTQQFFRQTGRYVLTADLNGDGNVDIAVNNYDSSDISVLLGRGDGTFEPQRRFNATAAPFSIDVGDINGDGAPDLVVIDSTVQSQARIGVLLNRADRLGRADWGFQPLQTFASPVALDFFNTRVKIVDLNGDGKNDLLVGSLFDHTTRVLIGNGDGTFTRREDLDYRAFGADLQIADLNGDGADDVVQTQYANLDKLSYSLNRGDGSGALFPPVEMMSGGGSPIASAVVDFNQDGILDLIVANSGEVQPALPTNPSVDLLPGLQNAAGEFSGFGEPIELAAPRFPHDLQVADLNRDLAPDIVVVDGNGLLAIFGKPPTILPNGSRAAARDLGVVTHLVQPTLTITPAHEEAWYRLRTSTEHHPQTKRQVLDFSGGFTSETGGGLMMQVVDSSGNVRGSGERFRVVAEQGEELFVRVFGAADAAGNVGAGAYTLTINTLPQVAVIESHRLLQSAGGQSGGPTTSIVIVLQGDRLDAAAAENPGNYLVTWLGADGVKGGGDDRVIAVGEGLPASARSVVYSPDSNFEVSSGLTLPSKVQQTVTLRFAEGLPAGSYEIAIPNQVVATAFNSDEAAALSAREGFNGHALVTASADGLTFVEGTTLTVDDLVKPAGADFSIDDFVRGNPFLQQIHNDLGALLDAELTKMGSDVNADDVEQFTESLLKYLIDCFGPAIFAADGTLLVPLLIAFWDPVSFRITSLDGAGFEYDLQTDSVSNQLQAYAEVGRNIELVVKPYPTGYYQVQVADVPASARGGMIFLGSGPPEVQLFTRALRAGVRTFDIFTRDFAERTISTATAFAALQSQVLATAGASFQLVVPSTTAAAATSIQSRLNEVAARSKQAATAAAEARGDQGGGGSAITGTLRAIGQAWDELSEMWEEFASGATAEGGATGNSGGHSQLLRAWQAVSEAWDELQGSEATSEKAPADRATEAGAEARQSEPATASQGDRDQAIEPQASLPKGATEQSQEVGQSADFDERRPAGSASRTNPSGEELGSDVHAEAA